MKKVIDAECISTIERIAVSAEIFIMIGYALAIAEIVYLCCNI